MALEYKREEKLKNEGLTDNIVQELPEYISLFTKYISGTKANTTVLSYARDLKQFFEYLNGNDTINVKLQDLESLNTMKIKDYERHLFKKESLSNATIKRKMSSIASLYKFLNENEMIKNNPMANYSYPKVEDHDITYLNEKQTINLLNGIRNNDLKIVNKRTGRLDKNKKPIYEKEIKKKTAQEKIKDEKFVLRDYAITMLILGTALRVSELVGLNVSDINFNDNYLLASRKGRGMSLKRVYFGNEVKAALTNYLYEKKEEDLDDYPDELIKICTREKDYIKAVEKAKKEMNIKEENLNQLKKDVEKIMMSFSRTGRKGFEPKKTEDALFLTTWGKRMSVRSVQIMIKEKVLCYLPNMKNNDSITPHKLRSTAATRMLFQTGDILLVSKQLDHSSPNVTAKFYAKLLEDKEKEKVAKLSVTNWNDDPEND